MSPSIDGKIVSKTGLLKVAYAATSVPRQRSTRTRGSSDASRCTVRGQVASAATLPEAADAATGFIAKAKARSYAIAIDPSGTHVGSNAIDDAHVITVLAERVSDDYWRFSNRGRVVRIRGQSQHRSQQSLAKLRTAFGIRRLLLEAAAGSMGHSSPPA